MTILGFDGVVENSIDAVSNRDFVLDYLQGLRALDNLSSDGPLSRLFFINEEKFG